MRLGYLELRCLMNIEAVIVATRILATFTNHTNLNVADVLLLHLYCPGNEELEPDELARRVIEEMMEDHRKQRAAKIGVQRVNGTVRHDIAS